MLTYADVCQRMQGVLRVRRNGDSSVLECEITTGIVRFLYADVCILTYADAC
jgi:hypothetical protein